MTHISVRLYWHDSGWDGTVCRDPQANVWCEAHDIIREKKDVPAEVENAGRTFTESAVKPPCEASTQAFSRVSNEIRYYPPKWLAEQRVKPVDQRLGPSMATLWPFEQMWTEDGSYKPNEERRRIAEEFFGQIDKGASLAFFYVDERNPLFIDDGERSPSRVLVGVSRIVDIGEISEYTEPDYHGEHNMVWAVPFKHGFPKDGVRLPVQSLLARVPDAEKRLPYLAPLDGGLRTDFRYGSSTISQDRAVAALERAISALTKIQQDQVVEGDFTPDLAWLNARLLEIWQERGPYPGIGSVLSALECPKAAVIQRRLIPELLESGQDPARLIGEGLDGKTVPELNEFEDDLDEPRDEWDYLKDEEKEVARLLFRMELTSEQAADVLRGDSRIRHGLPADAGLLIENPYLLAEAYLPSLEGERISFITVDHALLPHEVMSKSGLPKPIRRRDPRRLRTLLSEALHTRAEQGHTFASANDCLDYAARRSPQDRPCDVPADRLSDDRYQNVLNEKIEQFEHEDVTFLALTSLRDDELAIRRVTTELVRREYDRSFEDLPDWQSIADEQAKEREELAEVRLSEEQLAALRRAFFSPISVITGSAGSGKSTLLAPLLRGIADKEPQAAVRILTPTGKAADRLRQIGVEALTIHRALAAADWYDWELGVWRSSDNRIEVDTLVLDETSMADTWMLATLFRAVNWDRCHRLILVGDDHQLPPIGPGRPFYDIIAAFRNADERGSPAEWTERLSDLRFNYRVSEGSKTIALANSFTRRPEADAPALWTSVAQGKDEGDLRIRYWEDADQLYGLIQEEIQELLHTIAREHHLTSSDRELFNASLGHGSEFDPSFWQFLSPVKGDAFGTRRINALIQDEYHSGLKHRSRRGWRGVSFGNEQITLFDKAIYLKNERREGWSRERGKEKYQLYNGQLGLVTGTHPSAMGKRPIFIKIRFQGWEGLEFSFTNKGYDTVDGRMELAYAVTVHKAQGSQFNYSFVVVPREAGGLLSRELAYTALTRAREITTLFIEKDVQSLLPLRRMAASETPRRNSRLFETYAGGIPGYRPEGLISVTARGEPVRSKSEVIVANRLAEFDLDYAYEEELFGPSNDPRDMRLPDFTIRHRGHAFYWEHCGRVDDIAYMTRWEEVRLPWYKRNGYEEQLIVTYDKQGGGIDTTQVDDEIRRRILQEQ